MPWKAVASALAGGAAALPPGALAAALGGLAAGALLELASRRRAGRFLPAAGALGVGFVVPFVYASAIAAGALGGAAYRAARPDRADAALPVVGAGAIAGESLAGFAVAALGALGLVALRG